MAFILGCHIVLALNLSFQKKALELQDGMTLQVLLKVMEVANHINRAAHGAEGVQKCIRLFIHPSRVY